MAAEMEYLENSCITTLRDSVRNEEINEWWRNELQQTKKVWAFGKNKGWVNGWLITQKWGERQQSETMSKIVGQRGG